MMLYRSKAGPVVCEEGRCVLLAGLDWNTIFRQDDPADYLRRQAAGAGASPVSLPKAEELLPPLQAQEVWAAGVTYYRSRDARMQESQGSGGDTFYDKVYHAPRPELFYKGNRRTVVGHGQAVRIRHDARWNVPEPELTLVVNSRGMIFGYTIGNDMSSRDIEGENPLYLPQAKVYQSSCAIGPGILLRRSPLPPETEIRLTIVRGGATVFEGQTSLAELKRSPSELVEYLTRDNPFPDGVFLLTGTGIIPTDAFTLAVGDEVRIEIDGLGVLVNEVVQSGSGSES
jgi:2-dehydro-3-deoxy-D-arabinonate dehydratase